MVDFSKLNFDEQTLLTAVDRCPSVIVITTPTPEIVYVNERFTEVTGYSEEAALGKNPNLLSSGRQPPAFYEEMWATITAGEVWQGEYCNRKENGEIYWANAAIAPIFDDSGEIVHYIAVQQEVTREYRLRNRLQAMFDTSVSGLVTLSDAGEILDVNPALLEMFGYSREEILGESIPRLFSDKSDYDLLAQIEEYLDYSRAELVGEKKEMIAQKKDGSIFHVLFELNWFEIDTGSQFVGMFVDISEQVKYRRQLEEVNEELADKSRYLERLSPEDPRSGLANENWFEVKLEEEWSRCGWDSEPLSLLVIKVDYFDVFEASFEAQEIEECLRSIGELLKNQIQREIDTVAHCGAAEFHVLFPELEADEASQSAEEVRSAVEAMAIPHENSKIDSVVTVSVGVVSTVPGEGPEKWEFVEQGRRALERARTNGGNRVEVT